MCFQGNVDRNGVWVADIEVALVMGLSKICSYESGRSDRRSVLDLIFAMSSNGTFVTMRSRFTDLSSMLNKHV